MTTTTRPLKAASPFQGARARWNAAQAEHQALLERIEGLEAALVLTGMLPGEPDQERNRVVATRAERYLQGRQISRRRLALELEETRETLPASLERLHEERSAFDRASRDEAERAAKALVPHHRAAVLDLAKAVEVLCRSIAAEAAVRQEFARTAPEPASLLLPDVGSELLLGTLDDYHSPASAWARRLRSLGVLDG